MTAARLERTLGKDVRSDYGYERVDASDEGLSSLLPRVAKPIATLGGEEVERNEELGAGINVGARSSRLGNEGDGESVERWSQGAERGREEGKEGNDGVEASGLDLEHERDQLGGQNGATSEGGNSPPRLVRWRQQQERSRSSAPQPHQRHREPTQRARCSLRG